MGGETWEKQDRPCRPQIFADWGRLRGLRLQARSVQNAQMENLQDGARCKQGIWGLAEPKLAQVRHETASRVCLDVGQGPVMNEERRRCSMPASNDTEEQEIQSVAFCLLGASSTKRIGSEREGCNTLQARVGSSLF